MNCYRFIEEQKRWFLCPALILTHPGQREKEHESLSLNKEKGLSDDCPYHRLRVLASVGIGWRRSSGRAWICQQQLLIATISLQAVFACSPGECFMSVNHRERAGGVVVGGLQEDS